MYHKISIRIEEDLYRQVREHTVLMDCTITDVILQAVARFFLDEPETKEDDNGNNANS